MTDQTVIERIHRMRTDNFLQYHTDVIILCDAYEELLDHVNDVLNTYNINVVFCVPGRELKKRMKALYDVVKEQNVRAS